MLSQRLCLVKKSQVPDRSREPRRQLDIRFIIFARNNQLPTRCLSWSRQARSQSCPSSRHNCELECNAECKSSVSVSDNPFLADGDCIERCFAEQESDAVGKRNIPLLADTSSLFCVVARCPYIGLRVRDMLHSQQSCSPFYAAVCPDLYVEMQWVPTCTANFQRQSQPSQSRITQGKPWFKVA